jgi:p-cymene monooxygenase electron transfer component
MSGLLNRFFKAPVQQTATIQPWGTTIPVSSQQTLLEAALANKLPFPHNCTVGTCGSCKCRLISGKVSAITDFGYTLSAEELAAGYILACQAQVKSPVEIEVETPGEHLPPPQLCSGRITSRQPLTHDILEVTVTLDKPMQYVAGQYATLSTPNLPPRSYSFATAPIRNGRQTLVFFIRKVPGGAFTETLFNGDLDKISLSVDGPHGNFWLRPGTGPLLCIAGGSGLAPLLSLLDDARKNRLRRDCILLFGARTQADLYALDHISELENSWPNSFTFQAVLSHEPTESEWLGDRDLVTKHISPHLKNNGAGLQAYMCGPPPMIDAAVTELVSLGIRFDSIYYDKFTDASHLSRA